MTDRLPASRLAPTPSGFLHRGNAFSFILTWLMVRKSGGSLLLRIDDLDSARKRPEYVKDVFRSLEWLGLDWDAGPIGPDDFEANWSQRHRAGLYAEKLGRLCDTGLVFPCACTRSSIQRDSADGRHPQSCPGREQSISDPTQGRAGDSLRIKTDDAVTHWSDSDGTKRSIDVHSTMRDFVVRKKDGSESYQVASLADDEHFGINFVVRGEDLIDSTAAQLFLAQLTNGSFVGSRFVHHCLLPDDDGRKLSKSAGATSLKAMRESGITSQQLYTELSPLLGLAVTATSAAEALEAWAP